MAFYALMNQNTASFVHAVHLLKDTLIARGWVLEFNGDGLSAYSTTVDVLTNPSFSGSTVAGSMGNPNAYFVLRCPDGQRRIKFRHGSLNTGDGNSIQMFYSPSGGYTGSLDGAPSATVAPTAPNEIIVSGTARTGVVTTGCMWGVTGADRVDYLIGDADEQYSFCAWARFSGGGHTIAGGPVFDRLLNPDPDDLDPTVVGCGITSGSWFGTSSTRLFSSQTYVSTPSVGHASASFWAYARDPAAEGQAQNAFLTREGEQTATRRVIESNSGVNPYNGLPDLEYGLDWYRSGAQVAAGAQVKGAFGLYKGRSRIFLARSGHTGQTIGNVPTAKDCMVQSGGIWVRWDGSTTLNATISVNIHQRPAAQFFEPFGPAVVPVVPPYLLNVVPSDADIEATEYLGFEVYSASALVRVVVNIEYAGYGVTECAYDTAFRPPYDTLSTVEAVTNSGNAGLRFRIRRNSKWPDSPKLRVFAVNAVGAEL